MSLHLVTPFDQPDPTKGEPPVDDRPPRWQSWAADGCYILLRGSLFVGSSALIALGLPMLFFLGVSGGDPNAFFGHLANLAERFLTADIGRREVFLGEFKIVLIGLATLVAVWRLPRFVRDLDRELGEKL